MSRDLLASRDSTSRERVGSERARPADSEEALGIEENIELGRARSEIRIGSARFGERPAPKLG